MPEIEKLLSYRLEPTKNSQNTKKSPAYCAVRKLQAGDFSEDIIAKN